MKFQRDSIRYYLNTTTQVVLRSGLIFGLVLGLNTLAGSFTKIWSQDLVAKNPSDNSSKANQSSSTKNKTRKKSKANSRDKKSRRLKRKRSSNTKSATLNSNSSDARKNPTRENSTAAKSRSKKKLKRGKKKSKKRLESVNQRIITWFHPITSPSPKPNHSRVTLLGKTLPFAELSISSRKIRFIEKGKLGAAIRGSSELAHKIYTQADDQGFFELNVDLPYKDVRLYLKLRTVIGRRRTYQLSFNVEKEKDVVLRQKNIKASPYATKTWGIWAGLGMNLLIYTQGSSDINADLDHTSFKAPSFFFQTRWKQGPTWHYNFTAKTSPGEATTTSTVKVLGDSYLWSIYTLDATWTPRGWRQFIFNSYRTQYGLRFGLQQHSVPFLSRTGNSQSEVEVVNNSMTILAFGAEANVKIDRTWKFETFFRYQIPLSTGDAFSINPKFAFDGSIGFVRYLNKKWDKGYWRWGIFWYGQWHKYGFTHFDRFSKADIDGDQGLFFSNFDIRVGYEFE